MGDMEYRRPIKVNRYWNRPKPRVYECNMRDVERIYQDNYKRYLDEKDYRLRGPRDYSEDRVDRFAHLRAGPLRREQSAQPFSSRHETSSTVEGILTRASLARDKSEEAPSTLKIDAKPVPAYDPQKETQSLEERLARLKKLREDLGLPQDTESSRTTLRDSSASRSLANDTDSSYKSERTSRYRSAAASGATSDESSYSYKSERSAVKVNGSGDDYKRTPILERKRESYDLTPKTERKTYSVKKDLDDDFSSSLSKAEKKTERYSKLSATTASSSSPVRSRKVIAASEKLDFDDDVDDAVLAKMMKKMPSSQEILERISKMDLDD
ncbi:uncharacterized protein [Palaemon carinicauda]|uniref:uncharacterized protein n=1 Tax=Palaemon carinicauda TaxID=392227 RepID=UPI0035B5FFD0